MLISQFHEEMLSLRTYLKHTPKMSRLSSAYLLGDVEIVRGKVEKTLIFLVL